MYILWHIAQRRTPPQRWRGAWVSAPSLASARWRSPPALWRGTASRSDAAPQRNAAVDTGNRQERTQEKPAEQQARVSVWSIVLKAAAYDLKCGRRWVQLLLAVKVYQLPKWVLEPAAYELSWNIAAVAVRKPERVVTRFYVTVCDN